MHTGGTYYKSQKSRGEVFPHGLVLTSHLSFLLTICCVTQDNTGVASMRSFSANSGQTQSLTIRSREKTEQNCDRKFILFSKGGITRYEIFLGETRMAFKSLTSQNLGANNIDSHITITSAQTSLSRTLSSHLVMDVAQFNLASRIHSPPYST